MEDGIASNTGKPRLSAATRDGIVIFGIAIALLAIFIAIEAFEYVVEFSDTHESWELDEILTVLMVLPIAGGIFGWRRLKEARAELIRRVAAEEKAQAMALHDPLTGLPNRRHAERTIDAALAEAGNAPVAVLLLDLNRFKSVNDLYGHAAGDKLLLTTGERLRDSAGPGALVARLGGDEFTVMLTDVCNEEELIHRVELISGRFAQPFTFEHGNSTIGASIGVTLIDTPGFTADKVLAQADAAMYRCKAKGRNGFAFFEEGMEFAAIRRAEIEAELREAIAAGHIEPFYQPLVTLSDGELAGYEALARWRLPDGSLRMPEEFIHIAEDCRIIGDLYYSVLEQAANAVRHWDPELRFAVNLSPIQFEDEWLVERTLQILTAAGVSPGRLDIEITESALVANVEQAQRIVSAFKAQGIKVVLDDFGTGYSSLRHLSDLQFDQLKIDKSFITELDDNPGARTIVRTITSMAHSLGVQVTVEGIETGRNERDVMEFGCDLAQGFLYGRPTQQPTPIHHSRAEPEPSSGDSVEDDAGSRKGSAAA